MARQASEMAGETTQVGRRVPVWTQVNAKMMGLGRRVPVPRRDNRAGEEGASTNRSKHEGLWNDMRGGGEKGASAKVSNHDGWEWRAGLWYWH